MIQSSDLTENQLSLPHLPQPSSTFDFRCKSTDSHSFDSFVQFRLALHFAVDGERTRTPNAIDDWHTTQATHSQVEPNSFRILRTSNAMSSSSLNQLQTYRFSSSDALHNSTMFVCAIQSRWTGVEIRCIRWMLFNWKLLNFDFD